MWGGAEPCSCCGAWCAEETRRGDPRGWQAARDVPSSVRGEVPCPCADGGVCAQLGSECWPGPILERTLAAGLGRLCCTQGVRVLGGKKAKVCKFSSRTEAHGAAEETDGLSWQTNGRACSPSRRFMGRCGGHRCGAWWLPGCPGLPRGRARAAGMLGHGPGSGTAQSACILPCCPASQQVCAGSGAAWGCFASSAAWHGLLKCSSLSCRLLGLLFALPIQTKRAGSVGCTHRTSSCAPL